MAVKFSAFTTRTGTLDASTKIVGYDDPAGTKTNVEFSLATLAANSGIYAADGTIGTTRKALITDTIQFRNAGDTSDIFKLNTNGTFSLGLGASSGTTSAIGIGNTASATSTDSIAIGGNSTCSAVNSVSIGGYSSATAASVAAIGYDVDVTGANSIGLGHSVNSSGTESITINGASGVVTTSTQYAFGVYMTSNTTPDLEIVGGGESTLNTSLKITGQAYTEIETSVAIDSVNWNNGNVQEVTLVSGATTDFDTTNFKAGATYILKLIQPAGGNALVGWEAAGAVVNWSGGTPPTLSTAAAAEDIVTLICTSAAGNGTYYANATLNFS